MTTQLTTIDAAGVRALAWMNGDLIDVAGGWRSLYPAFGPARWGVYGDQFDAAAASPVGDVCVLVSTTGTKGLVLDPDGGVVREINRSYYCADAYRYPVALFELADGRSGLVHCPEDYRRLEVEVALTGERLARSVERDLPDVFHSRLGVSEDGARLVSAGWFWHPWDVVGIYDLRTALDDPHLLDTTGDPFGLESRRLPEIAGACALGDDLVVSTAADEGSFEEPSFFEPLSLTRWSLSEMRVVWQVSLTAPAGDLTRIGQNVLALSGWPRLFDGDSGELIEEWPGLPTGQSISSITMDETFVGPARVSVDPRQPRFAYTDGERVVVVDLAAG